MKKIAVGLCIAFVVIAGLNLTTRQVDTAQPAVVNPTGWDKPTIAKHLDDIINTCKKTPVWTTIVNKLNAKVCDLPYAIWGKLDGYLWTFKDQDINDVADLVIQTCTNFKLVLK